MNVQNGNKWKAALFLSIIVLAVFIVSLGLSGFMGGPVTVAETLVLDAVNWKHDRPCIFTKIPESTLETNYSNSEVSMNEKFQVGAYYLDMHGGGPGSTMAITNLMVSVQHGFVDSIDLNFSEGSSQSWGVFYYWKYNRPNSTIVLSDLSIEQLVDAQTNEELLGKDSKAFLRVKRVGEPSHVFLSFDSDYVFGTPHNFTDIVNISTKVTYFNGTVYKSLVEPVRFILGPDDNNSFGTAEEIKPDGQAHEFFIGRVDNVDFYKVYMIAGDSINVTLQGYDGDHDLSLYSPTNLTVPAAMLTGMTDIRYLKMLEYRVDCTGWWYIKVSAPWQVGLYALQVRLMKV